MAEDQVHLPEFVAKALGAVAQGEKFTLYIPNKGRAEEENAPQVIIQDWQGWIRRAMEMLGKVNGGATVLAPANGMWIDNDRSNEQVWEKTAIVYSFINRDAFRSQILQIREFVHSFGKETRQGAVFFEFDGLAFQVVPPYDA